MNQLQSVVVYMYHLLALFCNNSESLWRSGNPKVCSPWWGSAIIRHPSDALQTLLQGWGSLHGRRGGRRSCKKQDQRSLNIKQTLQTQWKTSYTIEKNNWPCAKINFHRLTILEGIGLVWTTSKNWKKGVRKVTNAQKCNILWACFNKYWNIHKVLKYSPTCSSVTAEEPSSGLAVSSPKWMDSL